MCLHRVVHSNSADNYHHRSDESKKNTGIRYQRGKRVGSSFVIHAFTSLRLGAASACELDDVKRVNENGF